MIASIYIPPLANAAFSATVMTEVTKILVDGGTVSMYNQRRVMRDGAGRIFQERRSFVPKSGQRQPEVTRIEISDPKSHKRYLCVVARHACNVASYSAPTTFTSQPAGPLANGNGDLTREDLGTNLIHGVEAVGTRETVVLNPGVAGNDRPLSMTREFWYSPRLGINLVEKRADPRTGTELFTVNDIVLSEPDSAAFAIPAGFKVLKRPAPDQEP